VAILTFTLTEKEFLGGRKTVTRRDWQPNTLRRWQRWWDEGRYVHDAWNGSPRTGGRCIGRLRLTCRPYRERLADMPEADLSAEGGMCATLAGFYRLIEKSPEDVMCVVRFERLSE
jgi:hypothetical protein